MEQTELQESLDSHQQRDNTPDFVKTVHREPYAAIDPNQPSLSAAGKTIIITGGATGIGFAIARNFAAAGAATVVLLARRAPTLETASTTLSDAYPSTQVLTYPTDITNPQSVMETLKSVMEAATSHTIDILVTSAVYAHNQAATLDIPESQIRDSFETNVLGNLSLITNFLAITSSSPKIILDVSSAAAFGVYPFTSVYGASKYALSFIIKHIQNENPDKVRVHSFHPGVVWTPAVESFAVKKEHFETVLDNVDLPGRFAVWLASEQAEFLKGRYVFAKWDVEDLVKNKEAFESDATLATVQLKV